MSAADASLEITGGSLQLRVVKRFAEVRHDGSLRLDGDGGSPHVFAEMVIANADAFGSMNASIVLDGDDCRKIAAQLVAMARLLQEGA